MGKIKNVSLFILFILGYSCNVLEEYGPNNSSPLSIAPAQKRSSSALDNESPAAKRAYSNDETNIFMNHPVFYQFIFRYNFIKSDLEELNSYSNDLRRYGIGESTHQLNTFSQALAKLEELHKLALNYICIKYNINLETFKQHSEKNSSTPENEKYPIFNKSEIDIKNLDKKKENPQSDPLKGFKPLIDELFVLLEKLTPNDYILPPELEQLNSNSESYILEIYFLVLRNDLYSFSEPLDLSIDFKLSEQINPLLASILGLPQNHSSDLLTTSSFNEALLADNLSTHTPLNSLTTLPTSLPPFPTVLSGPTLAHPEATTSSTIDHSPPTYQDACQPEDPKATRYIKCYQEVCERVMHGISLSNEQVLKYFIQIQSKKVKKICPKCLNHENVTPPGRTMVIRVKDNVRIVGKVMTCTYCSPPLSRDKVVFPILYTSKKDESEKRNNARIRDNHTEMSLDEWIEKKGQTCTSHEDYKKENNVHHNRIEITHVTSKCTHGDHLRGFEASPLYNITLQNTDITKREELLNTCKKSILVTIEQPPYLDD